MTLQQTMRQRNTPPLLPAARKFRHRTLLNGCTDDRTA
jgi:hypothetical protein